MIYTTLWVQVLIQFVYKTQGWLISSLYIKIADRNFQCIETRRGTASCMDRLVYQFDEK